MSRPNFDEANDENDVIPKYPYAKLDGTLGYTILTPSAQVEAAQRIVGGESIKQVADRLDVGWREVGAFVKESGLFERQAEAMAELLATQYLDLRQQQLAVAGDYVNKARALAAELFAVMEAALQEWRRRVPKDLTPQALAKLIQQFRELQKDWVQLVGVPAGVERTEHRMMISKDTMSKEITVDHLIEQGLTVEQIDGFIEIAEQLQTKALPSGERYTEHIAAPGPPTDEGEPGAVVVSEGT